MNEKEKTYYDEQLEDYPVDVDYDEWSDLGAAWCEDLHY